MRVLRVLLLAARACLPAATQEVTLNFSAPVRVAAAGQYADAAFRLAGGTLVLQAAPLPPGGARFAASPDLGGSWAAVTAGSCAAARLAGGRALVGACSAALQATRARSLRRAWARWQSTPRR
jgi:hypothetical protein